MPPLPRSFYARPAIEVAKALLGQVLVHDDAGTRRAGRIVETEAYVGPHDLACHASKGRTRRTEVMFGDPGHAYVYLIYGMYDCFNVVVERASYPAAVLVRGVSPITECMGSTDGPGKLTRALRITRGLNGADLLGPVVWIEEGATPTARSIARGPRIGVEYAGLWATRTLRFWIRGDRFVSRRRG